MVIATSFCPLPVSTACWRLRRYCGGTRYHCELRTIGDAGIVLTPCHLISIGTEVLTCDVVMNTNLRTTDTAKEALGLIGASAILRIRLFVVDTLYWEVRGQLVPMCRLVSMNS